MSSSDIPPGDNSGSTDASAEPDPTGASAEPASPPSTSQSFGPGGSDAEQPGEPDAQLGTLRGLVSHATQQLLGDTIAVSDEDWQAPSALPDWNRAQVATHIARQAEAMGRLASWALTGERQDMYASPEQRSADIDAGRARSGLDLQIDLDESAGKLSATFDALDGAGRWDATVELRNGSRMPARMLPLGRLNEVILHHLDLKIGWGVDNIDAQTADWLLEWCAFRLQDRSDFPALELSSPSGATITVGTAAEPARVGGPSPRLLTWLTGRSDDSGLTGADGRSLPTFG